jgi:DNA-binding NarL/FixJ family response regulator
VLDEWPLIRLGVSKVLGDEDVRVVADPADAASALAAVRAHQPDLLVIGGHAGPQAELARQALAALPTVQCIVLVPSGEERDLRLVLLAGARAVVPRTVAPEELRDAVRRVVVGDHVVSPSLLPRMFEGNGDAAGQAERAAGRPPVDVPVLTVREREIVRLLGAGRSNAEIASALFVSAATVKTHLAHIYEKLGVRSRYDALGRAVALGLLD